MKQKKYLLISIIFCAVLFIYTSIVIHSYPNGFTGVTKKDGGIGCICHNPDPSASTSVFFEGPDSVAAGESATYLIKIVNNTGTSGGFDAASYSGQLDPVISDTTLRLDSSRGELTHRFPKLFSNDTVYWTFKYTAPTTLLVDTLYAVGNSTNNNGLADSLDRWNFSDNFTITVYNPISVNNNSKIADGFKLNQNFPNPFNPETNIEVYIGKKELVKLVIYDILGHQVKVLNNTVLNTGNHTFRFDASSYPSGVYFTVLSSKSYNSTIKMLLLK
ncbi:MAG: T9SS C-terminal target domain-containing protein [Ignavibacteriae bacterium]|nr:MAG: T9SS C-terminal target domain-containing protein [Ignavibacteriota bacterium]